MTLCLLYPFGPAVRFRRRCQDDTLGEDLESFAWLEDFIIAVGQGPARFQSRVNVRETINYGALLIKDEVMFGTKLDCRWKSVLETMQKKVEEKGGLA